MSSKKNKMNILIIDQIIELPSFKYSVNNFHFINQNNEWALNNGSLDFSLFYSEGLNLFEKAILKHGKPILKAMGSAITGPRITDNNKNTMCLTGFSSNKVDFPTLLCLVSVPHSVCDFNKHIFSKRIFKAVSTSSIRLCKPINDSHVCQSKPVNGSNVRPNKPVNASYVSQGKTISNSNVCPRTPISASSVRQGKLICEKEIRLSEPVITSKFEPSKPSSGGKLWW